MQKISLHVIAVVLNLIMLLYYALYFYWMFGITDMDTHPLTQVFVTINPMTWGTYFLEIEKRLDIIFLLFFPEDRELYRSVNVSIQAV